MGKSFFRISKKKVFFIVSIIIIFIGLCVFKYKMPENTIKKSFDYTNNKNLEKLLDCYTDRNKDSDFRLYNIKKVSLKKIELIKDEEMYNQYFSSGLGSINNISRNNIKIFNVDYHIEYNDENIEPQDSGDDSKYYNLIKENGSWKIDTIGNQ